MVDGGTRVTMDLGGIKKLAELPQTEIPRLLKRWAARYRSFLQERFDKFSKGGGDWPPLKPSTIARRAKAAAHRRVEAKTKPKAGTGRRKKRKSLFGAAISLTKGLFTKAKKSKPKAKPKPKKKAPAQVKAKKKKAKKAKSRKASILRDRGLLFAALSPTFNGAPGAVEEVGYLKISVGYGGPAKHPDTHLTIAELVEIHDKGLGVVPIRKIIVPPSSEVLDSMMQDAEKMVAATQQ